MLAKEMEAATYEMRSGILAAPFTWREAITIWRGLQGENRVTAKMSESYGSGTPDGEERGHNGLQSIEEALGTQDYSRLRIGVGAVPQHESRSDWVLSEFDDAKDEDAVLEALPRLGEAVELWARTGIEAAMNQYNASPEMDE